MYVEQTDDIMTVRISPNEILQMIETRRVGVLDVELLCPLIYQLGVAKRRKQSFATIANQRNNISPIFIVGDRIIKDDSANMCLQLVEHAGISQKGLGAFRRAIREEAGATIKNGVASDTKHHVSLDWLDESYYCAGLVNRAIHAGEEFIRGIGELNNSWNDWSSTLRIGLLVLAKQNSPDYTIEMHYNMSKNDKN